MSKLIINTQYCENYGSPDEPYWKMKGGSEYVVKGLDFDADYEWAEVYVGKIMDKILDQIEISNAMCEEYVLGWSLVEDGHVTPSEEFGIRAKELILT